MIQALIWDFAGRMFPPEKFYHPEVAFNHIITAPPTKAPKAPAIIQSGLIEGANPPLAAVAIDVIAVVVGARSMSVDAWVS